MDPTPNYYKTKRTLLLFVGALLLAIFAGFRIVNGEQRVSFLPFQLARPELLTTILFIGVIFYIFQFSLQWAAQLSEIQNNRFHRIDFIATTTISGISIICYAGWLLSPYAYLIETGKVTAVLTAGAISATASIFGSRFLERFSATLGRWIKGKEAVNDERLADVLKSKPWVLNYNPTHPGKLKDITFLTDDRIGIGANNNETKWRVRNGLLEILNHQDRVFSRFTYNNVENSFEHTNDPDTLSIKGQTIRPKT